MEQFLGTALATAADCANLGAFLQTIPVAGALLNRFLYVPVADVEAGTDYPGPFIAEFAFPAILGKVVVNRSPQGLVTQHRAMDLVVWQAA